MDIGHTPPSDVEVNLQKLSIRVIVSRRLRLESDWKHHLLSPFWRLYVNKRAGASVAFDGKRLALNPGHLYLIPGWLPFETGWQREVIQDFIHFDFTGFPPALHRKHFNRIVGLPLQGGLLSCCREWQKGFLQNMDSPWLHMARTHSLVYAAMAEFLEKHPEGKECFRWLGYSSSLRPALEEIEKQLSNPPDNPKLAKLCGCSTDHFIRTFRKTMGLSPSRYGQERRLSTAARWLTETERSLEDIAESAGFTDRFHFSKVFKSRLGLPPVAYRKLQLSSIG